MPEFPTDDALPQQLQTQAVVLQVKLTGTNVMDVVLLYEYVDIINWHSMRLRND
jgi:hypothetical protein